MTFYSSRDMVDNARKILAAHVKANGRCVACGADRCPKRAAAIRLLYSRQYAPLPARRGSGRLVAERVLRPRRLR